MSITLKQEAVMGKSRKGNGVLPNGRSKGSGRFVMLDYMLLDCPAGQSLKPGELAILIRIMQRYHGENNGRIAMSNRDAALLANVNKDTASRHLRSLCEKGFIRVKKKSAFRRNGRKATEYSLTMFPYQNGHPPSRDFQKWKPPTKNKP